MSEEQPDRFFELAMTKIAGKASETELAELDGLIAADASLQEEYQRLEAECQLLKEAVPLAEATEATEGEFPEYARANLQMEVKEALGRPEPKKSEGQGFWSWGLGLAGASAMVLLIVSNSDQGQSPSTNTPGNADKGGNPNAKIEPKEQAAPIIQIAMLDVGGASRGPEDTTKDDLQKAWPTNEVKEFSDPAKFTDEWLKVWPVDAKGPVAKIHYIVSSGELKVFGKTSRGTFEKSFKAENLPAKLKQAQEYLKEQLNPAPNK